MCSLVSKGLAKGAFIEGGELEGVTLTNAGKSYIRNNPKLKNPTDWSKTADNLTSADDTSEKDVNAKIDTAIDAVLPYLQVSQSLLQ